MSRATAGALLLALVALAWWWVGDASTTDGAAVVSLVDAPADEAGALPTLGPTEAPTDLVAPEVAAPAVEDAPAAASDATSAPPRARLRGRVRWREGGAVVGAELSFGPPMERVGYRRARSSRSLAEATTDDQGRFAVDLPPGVEFDVFVATPELASSVLRQVRVPDAEPGTIADTVEVVLDPPCELVVLGLDEYARAHPTDTFSATAPSSEVAAAHLPLSGWTGRVTGLSRGSVVHCVLQPRGGTSIVLAADVPLLHETQELRVTPPEEPTSPETEPWRLRWRVVTAGGTTADVRTFFESGIDPMSAGLPARATASDGRVEELTLRCQDVVVSGDAEVSLPPPLDVELRMGDLTATARVESSTDEARFVLDGVLDAEATTRVVLEPSAPPRPPLVVTDAGRARMFMAVVQDDGSISFLAAPGRYAVSALSQEGGWAVAALEVRGEPELRVPLEFEEGAYGSGRLEPPPAPGEAVTLGFHHHTLDGLTPVNPTLVRADGTFDLRRTAAGPYAVAVQRRAAGVTDVTVEELELRPGEQELLIVASRRADPRRATVRLEGALQGYVSLEDRATGRRAQLFLTEASTEEVALPPGDWTYLAVLKTARNGHTITKTGPLPADLVLSP